MMPMHLIQILLPLYDNEGRAYGRAPFDALRRELLEAFGGLTAYTRSPAQGMWEPEDGQPSIDEIVILEVMAAQLDRAWWAGLRQRLETTLRQQSIVIRSQMIDVL